MKQAFWFKQVDLPNVNIEYVSNTFLNFQALGRLILPTMDVAEWLGSPLFKRRAHSSNSDAIAFKSLMHVIIWMSFRIYN